MISHITFQWWWKYEHVCPWRGYPAFIWKLRLLRWEHEDEKPPDISIKTNQGAETQSYSYQTVNSYISFIVFGGENGAILERNDVTGCSGWCQHNSLLAERTDTNAHTDSQDTPPPTSLTACCDAEWRLLVKLTDPHWQHGQSAADEKRRGEKKKKHWFSNASNHDNKQPHRAWAEQHSGSTLRIFLAI